MNFLVKTFELLEQRVQNLVIQIEIISKIFKAKVIEIGLLKPITVIQLTVQKSNF